MFNRSFIGEKDDSIVKILFSATEKDWERYFEANVPKDDFYNKFKVGTCYVYCTPIYFAAFLRYINLIPLNNKLLNLAIRYLVPRKRIIFSSAFITLIDEVVDNLYNTDKRKKLERTIYGKGEAKGKEKILRYVAKELISMGADMTKVLKWAEGEENSKNNRKHKEPYSREKGIEMGIELSAWSASLGKKEKRFIRKGAVLLQMTDDVIDKKKDKKESIITPATEGIWTEKTIKIQFSQMKKECRRIIRSKDKADKIERGINWGMDWLIDTLENV